MSTIQKIIGAIIALLVIAAGAVYLTQPHQKTAKEQVLRIQFTPSEHADELAARAKPLGEALSKALDMPVKVSVSTDYGSIVEAMAAKKVDVGFLPTAAYVSAHDQYGVKPALLILRQDVNAQGQSIDKLVNFYRSEILVRKDSGINSVQDLKGKKIAVQDPTSASGYIYGVLALDKAGLKLSRDWTPVNIKGHDQAAIAVENRDVDAAFVWQDVRSIITKDVPTIFKDTKVLSYSANIPNDMVATRKDLDPALKAKIEAALMDYAKDKDGQKVLMSIYNINGFEKAKDSDFDIVREANKALAKTGN